MVDQEGKSISDLFAIIGESRFRFLETQCLFGLPPYNLVLSTGGGMMRILKECDIFKQRATCVYLDVPIDILVNRRNNDPGDRPILFNAKDISEEYQIALREKIAFIRE